MSDQDKVVRAVLGKTDYDAAADLRRRLEPRLAEIALIIDEAVQLGFVVNFNISPQPPLGKNRAHITVAKYFV